MPRAHLTVIHRYQFTELSIPLFPSSLPFHQPQANPASASLTQRHSHACSTPKATMSSSTQSLFACPVSQANPYRTEALRPMRAILSRLPLLPINADQQVNFSAASPDLLVLIAEDAEMMMATTWLGLGAVGQLLANSAPMIEDGSVSADCIEGLGRFQSEMSDMANHFMGLAAQCRQHSAAYSSSPKSPFTRIHPPDQEVPGNPAGHVGNFSLQSPVCLSRKAKVKA